jgi:hypothetical protein
VRRRERLAGALDDRVERPGGELEPEQLIDELDGVAAGGAVADGERGNRHLQARTEGAAGIVTALARRGVFRPSAFRPVPRC